MNNSKNPLAQGTTQMIDVLSIAKHHVEEIVKNDPRMANLAQPIRSFLDRQISQLHYNLFGKVMDNGNSDEKAATAQPLKKMFGRNVDPNAEQPAVPYNNNYLNVDAPTVDSNGDIHESKQDES